MLRRPSIRLTVNADNLRAFHLYQKRGFVEGGRRVLNRGLMGRFGHGRDMLIIDMVLRCDG